MTRHQTAIRIALTCTLFLTPALGMAQTAAPTPAPDYVQWPLLRSTFPSTGGGGMMIKGYDPVVTSGKCITTFMAVPPGDAPPVYANLVEFDAVPTAGGILCTGGKWRAMDGGATGTTPFEMFFKDGVFRAKP